MQEMAISNLVWCCAVGFFFSGLIGLGEVALEIWLILHYTSLDRLTGIMTYISYAFLASGGLASLTGLLGFVGSIKMKWCLLSLSIPLLMLSVLCQAVVWTVTYVVQIQVSTDLVDNLNGTTEYYKTLDHHYNCQLQNSSMGNYELQLEICSSFLSRQLWTYVYSLLVMCVTLICLQVIIALMAAKLGRQLKKRNNRVDSIPQLDHPLHNDPPNNDPPYNDPPHNDPLRNEAPPNFIESAHPSTVSHTLEQPTQPSAPPSYEAHLTAVALPPINSPPPPTAPPQPRPQLRPISAPPVPHILPSQQSHSCPTFDPALLPHAPQRSNFNRTNPLPRIPSCGDQYPLYEQNYAPADYGGTIYEQSRM